MKYLIKRILNLSYKNMFNIINEIHLKSNKSKIFLFFDIVYCGLRYQAGYMDYYILEFFNLKNKERKTYITRGINNKYIKYFNDKSFTQYFENKELFNEKFKKFLKREFFIINNNEKEFNEFIKGKKELICKPKLGSCGVGIEKIKVKKNLYKYLESKNLTVIEEVIQQHPKLNKLNKYSVNSIRILGIVNEGKPNIVMAYFRIGSNKKFVDNFNNGGMVVPINIKTGKVEFPAISKNKKIYDKHPDSNINIIGFEIPNWDKVIKIVKEASMIVSEIRMVGWDVAIMPNDVCLIEGNDFPGHDIYDLPVHRSSNYGSLDLFYKIKKL